MPDLLQYLEEALYLLPGIVIALTLHEFCHAWVSDRLGDPLPKATGRLSLNPARHIDLFGFIMLFLVRFGWAKPVIVDPRYYKHKKLDMSLVALAGPAANLVLAFLMTGLAMVTAGVYNNAVAEYGVPDVLPYTIVYTVDGMAAWLKVMVVVYRLLVTGVALNLGLALFNLIPISPLDGSKVLAAFLPLKAYNKVLRYERYGFLVLLLLLLNIPGRLLNIVGVSSAVTQYLDLSFYLNIAREFLWELFRGAFRPLLQLFL